MKNTLFYLLISIFISIGFAGCQQVEDIGANIPVVKTYEAENISATTATVCGEVEPFSTIYYSYYFLVSEDSTFPDDNRMTYYYEEYEYEEYEPEDSSSRIKVKLDGLMPGTTYYYVMCVTNGSIEVRGDVMSFTTMSNLEIEAVYKASGEQYTDDILGVYLTNADLKIFADYGNMEAWRNDTKGYKLPYDFAVTEQTNIYVYTPYNPENSTETLEINIRANGDTDYQYGNSIVDPERPKTSIEMRSAMQSAMAKLLITLSIDDSFEKDYLGVEYINLRNTYRDGAEKLYLEGSLNLSDGSIKPKFIKGHDGIFKYIKWSWKKGYSRSYTTEMYVIPTSFTNEELVLAVNTDAGYVEIPIPGSTWEKGNTYEIPLTINISDDSENIIGDAVYMGFNGDNGKPLYWSLWNLGATSPEDYGGLYGWADPTGAKRSVELNDYPSANPPTNIAGTEYDIARERWGARWRIPSAYEMSNLIDCCVAEWTSVNGINGVKYTSNINGNSLFFPVAPIRLGIGLEMGDFTCYWLSTLSEENTELGYTFCINYTNGWEAYLSIGMQRFYGLPIRPVTE